MSSAHVITVSDGVSATTRDDDSGRALVRILKDAGFEVIGPVVVPDEERRIAEAIVAAVDSELMSWSRPAGLDSARVT